VALASTVGVRTASISLLLPRMIRGGNLAPTKGAEPSNPWAGPTRGQGIGDLKEGSDRDTIPEMSPVVWR
jgi:hypothetical protein